jgi:Zn-dependent M28 family amino/carboxypeptidase
MQHDIRFGREIVFAAFSGEEQGLLGSKALANKWKAEGRDIALMIQADMVGTSFLLSLC